MKIKSWTNMLSKEDYNNQDIIFKKNSERLQVKLVLK